MIFSLILDKHGGHPNHPVTLDFFCVKSVVSLPIVNKINGFIGRFWARVAFFFSWRSFNQFKVVAPWISAVTVSMSVPYG